MADVKVVVEVLDPRTGEVEVRSFQNSPVRVGSGSWSALRLADPGVSTSHGEIWFDDKLLAFGNLSSKNGTWLDGAVVAPGMLVWLGRGSVLQIGRYRLQAFVEKRPLEPDGAREWRSASDDPTLPHVSLDQFPFSSVEFMTRAVAVVAEVASALASLRRLGIAVPAVRPVMTDEDEILNYLLDPAAPVNRIVHLRNELGVLVSLAGRLVQSAELRRGSA